jgi:hypothetical protein
MTMAMERTAREQFLPATWPFRLTLSRGIIAGERFGVAKHAKLVSIPVLNSKGYVFLNRAWHLFC